MRSVVAGHDAGAARSSGGRDDRWADCPDWGVEGEGDDRALPRGPGPGRGFASRLLPLATRRDRLERIRVDGENIGENALIAVLEEILGFVRSSDRAASFFEVMAAAAVQLFASEGVDLAIFEVGLGGRLDATTAIPVDASILTTIELEHTELLGDTAAAIAGEKAPVLRAGQPGFTSVPEGGDGALAELRRHAAEVGCQLEELGRTFGVRALRSSEDGAGPGSCFAMVEIRHRSGCRPPPPLSSCRRSRWPMRLWLACSLPGPGRSVPFRGQNFQGGWSNSSFRAAPSSCLMARIPRGPFPLWPVRSRVGSRTARSWRGLVWRLASGGARG